MKNGRKVVEVVGSLAVGGAERVALEVAAGLAGRGWRTEMLIAGPEDPDTKFQKSIVSEAEKRGVPVHHVPFTKLTDASSTRRLARWLRENDVGVVHVHNRPQDWQVVAICRALRIPVFYTVHLPYTFDNLRSRMLYVALGRSVKKVVCVSKAVADQVAQSELVPADRLHVIYNGIRMDVFVPPTPEDRAAGRRELGWGDDDFGWIMAARLHPQKGHCHLLDAIAKLPAGSKSKFALAGDGPLEDELHAQTKRLGIEDRVNWLGPRRDVPRLLGAADGYACSSMQEGHPLSLLEAMAVELPVVAPRLPSIVEIAMDGTPVFYGPDIEGWAETHDPQQMADAFVSVEKNAAAVKEKAKAARGHIAEQYSLDAMLTKHEQVYGELMK